MLSDRCIQNVFLWKYRANDDSPFLYNLTLIETFEWVCCNKDNHYPKENSQDELLYKRSRSLSLIIT